MELITSVTVGAGGTASVTLPATGTIPATYTDLKVLISSRASGSGGAAWSDIVIKPNNSTTGIATRVFYGTGSAPGSTTFTTGIPAVGEGNVGTANTFGNTEIYIPNYTSSNFKSFSTDSVSENNATASLAQLGAMLWSNTSAITSLVFTDFGSANFVEGSTFYLYGISSVTSTPKATGGMVSQDSTYWYHTFASSGVFTTTEAITNVESLIIAGGGGGGKAQANEGYAGGGGAGGFRIITGASLGATTFAVTVGAGGAGSTTSAAKGGNGGTSTFNSNSSSGGGGGASGNDPSLFVGNNGGSGGGSGGAYGPATGNLGGYTPVEGYNGGQGNATASTSGGGGGAGGAGISGTLTASGIGGPGNNTASSWALATYTGVNGFYAGGGGGSMYASDGGAGGSGGGGAGVFAQFEGVSGTTNTGSGGGARGGWNTNFSTNGGNGGSGLVIVRYAK
jgi:hypothetical protein